MTTRNEAIEMMLIAIGEEFDREIAHREKPRGGQHVTHTGEFASAGPSIVAAMRRWSRDFRRVLALPKVSPPVDAEAREKALVAAALTEGARPYAYLDPADETVAALIAAVDLTHPRSDATRASGDESLERAIGWVRGVAHMLPPGSEMRRTLANALTVLDMRVFGHHASLAPSPSLPPDETRQRGGTAPDAPPCEPDIYENGEPVLITSGPAWLIEAWVKRIRDMSKQRVDWHYSAGRACILCIGDAAKVTAAIEACPLPGGAR